MRQRACSECARHTCTMFSMLGAYPTVALSFIYFVNLTSRKRHLILLFQWLAQKVRWRWVKRSAPTTASRTWRRKLCQMPFQGRQQRFQYTTSEKRLCIPVVRYIWAQGQDEGRQKTHLHLPIVRIGTLLVLEYKIKTGKWPSIRHTLCLQIMSIIVS
jgi:hypothetical protein